jgi:hypothetical protein
MQYEVAKGRQSDQVRIAKLRETLSARQSGLLAEIENEKQTKGKLGRRKISELTWQLRGLLFGKN